MTSSASTPPKRDAAWVASRVQLYKRFRFLFLLLVAGVSASVLIAWFVFRSPIDHRRFDSRRFTVVDVIDGNSFVIADDARTRVSLLGAVAPVWPDAHYSKQSAGYLTGRLNGQVVLLKLDSPQTRDAADRLLAYVYLTDTDCINADTIRDGRAFSDRRIKHTFRQQFDQTENEARAKARGMWDEMSDDKMPAWRLEWLRSR